MTFVYGLYDSGDWNECRWVGAATIKGDEKPKGQQ